MPKINAEDFLEGEDLKNFQHRDNPMFWENMCGACDHFDTDKCPFRDQAKEDTEWGENVFKVPGIKHLRPCDHFID